MAIRDTTVHAPRTLFCFIFKRNKELYNAAYVHLLGHNPPKRSNSMKPVTFPIFTPATASTQPFILGFSSSQI